MKFKFSVVMISHNCEKYINESIDSIINQSLDFKENIEIIVVDDCSSDSTVSFIKEYCDLYPENVKLIENDVVCGIASSRNIGLDNVNGEYVSFLNASDYLSKDACFKVLSFFEEYVNRIDLVSIPICYTDGDAHKLNFKFNETGLVDLLDNTDYIQVHAPSSFIRVSSINNIRFEEDLKFSYDSLFINQILLRKSMYGIVFDETYYLRKLNNSKLDEFYNILDNTVFPNGDGFLFEEDNFDSLNDGDVGLAGDSDSLNSRDIGLAGENPDYNGYGSIKSSLVFNNGSLVYESFNDESYFVWPYGSNIRLFYDKSYFTDRIDKYFIGLINRSLELYGEVVEFIQYVLMYDLSYLMEIEHVDSILTGEELRILYKKLFYILDYIGDNIIFNHRFTSSKLKAHMVLLRYFKWNYIKDKTFNFNVLRNGDYVKTNKSLVNLKKKDLNFLMNELEFNKVMIDKFEFVDKNTLYISGILVSFFNKDVDVTVSANGEEFEVNKLSYPQRDNYSLNFNYGYNHVFDVKIPIDLDTRISFNTNIEDLNKLCEDLGLYAPNRESLEFLTSADLDFANDLFIGFNKSSSLSKESIYKLSKDYISISRENTIFVSPVSTFDFLKREFNTLIFFIQNNVSWSIVLMRILYFVLYPLYRNKRIWIFADSPLKIEDNSFELFRYINKMDEFNDDNQIKKVFVYEKNYSKLNDSSFNSFSNRFKRYFPYYKGSEEYKSLKEIGNVLPYKSLKHYIYSLFAECIISFNGKNEIIYPFWNEFEYFSGLLKNKKVFIENSITLNDLSAYINNYDNDFNLIIHESSLERKALLDLDYGYDEKNIKALGLAKYDLIEKLKPNKEIVIIPSWRDNLYNLSKEEFVHTKFFKYYNKLINDTELIEFLDKAGYKLVFQFDMNLIRYIDLFDKNSKVVIDCLNLSSYFESKENLDTINIINHSSLLITDFSPVAFEFAYIKKPVIYYQFENNPYDIGEDYFDYETMGFGEVTKSHEELVDLIKEYIKYGCEMDDIYADRVNDFFDYTDKNNSKRIYESILDLDWYW